MKTITCNPKRLFFWLTMLVCALAGGVPAARAVNLVQEFYLPMPEAQILQAAKAVAPSDVTQNNYTMITSILITGSNTVIYYDQWEDGYEANIASPTQATTQIWGDGNDAHGVPPGFAHNPAGGFSPGTVITLSNTIPCSPRNPSQIYYDGADHIAANKALVITRAGWPTQIGPEDAGAAVVLSTLDYGTNFVSPIGQDMPEDLFNYVAFFVMAAQDNTTVTIDLDGAGPTLPTTVTLNKGQSYLVNGGVKRGGTISASAPVEVNLVCGDTTDIYAFDWFTLYPKSEWSGSYFTPVPSFNVSGGGGFGGGGGAYTTINYFYNATVYPITILYTNVKSSGTFVIPANGGAEYPMLTNSGASFTSAAGEPFTVLTTVDSNATNDPTGSQDFQFNWGYTPLPAASLTTESHVGWAPGSSDFSVNGNPVWVTPVANTTLYVIYGSGATPLTDSFGRKYSTNFVVNALQSKKIYTPGTNSQTGMIIYTLDNTLFSTAWGEDPAVAPELNPGLDCGTSVLPFPIPRLTKSAVIVTDTPPSGLSDGDTVQYTVRVDNRGLLPLGNTVVVDWTTPALNYVSNSTTLNGIPIPDSTNGFPLGAPGYTIPIILSQGTSVFQYLDKVNAGGGVTGVTNIVNIGSTSLVVTNYLPPGYGSNAPAVSAYKTLVSPAGGTAGIGQIVEFNLEIIDTGNTILTNLMLVDNYPATNFSFISASVPASTTNAGQLTWTSLGSFYPGQFTNISVYLQATNVSPSVTNFMTASSLYAATNTSYASLVISSLPVAAVAVHKTLLSPPSGPAGVGQTVQYNLQVVNSGFTTLTNVSLEDDFPLNYFSFVSASVPPDANNNGSLTWANLGKFAPGQFTNITVSFTVTNYADTLTNFMTAASVGGATNTTSVGLPITSSSLTITKTILSPTDVPVVNITSNIVFRILIQNSGQIPIETLPLDDTYPADIFQFVSATIPPDNTAPGHLYWTDITGGNSLAPNAVITNDVTMTVLAGASPAINTAYANNAIDSNGTTVAPASGSVGATTATNVPPQANLDFFSMTENTTNTFDPLANDVLETPGGTLIIITINPTNGTASIIGGTNVQFTPDLNFTGPATIGYTITDGIGGTNSSLITITVTNIPPQANPDAFSMTENTTNTFDPLGNDSVETLGGVLAIIGVNPTNGTADIIGGTNVQFTPDLNFTGTATVGYTITDGIGGTNGSLITITVTNIPLSADLAVFKTGPVSGIAGSNLTYSVTITNLGPDTASNVVVSDQLPAEFTFVSASNGGMTNNSNLVSWPAIILATNTAVSFTVTAISVEGGNYTNIASSTSDTPDPNTCNNDGTSTNSQAVTAVSPLADVAVFKTGDRNVLAGGVVTYTITATNIGPSTATGVVVTDTLPANVVLQSASGSPQLNGNLLTWPAISLVGGSSTSFTVMVTAPANGMQLTNIASGGADTPDPNPTNNNGTLPASQVTTTVIPSADIQVYLSGPASAAVGDGFIYTTVVTNAGPSTAVNTLVTNLLPTNLVFASASGGGVYTNGIVTWPVFASLINGQATNLTVTVSTSSGNSTNSPTSNPFNFIETNVLPTGLVLTNRASAFAATFDPNLTNNSASVAYTNAQVQTAIVPGIFSIFVATNTYATNTTSYHFTNTVTPIGVNLFVVGAGAFNPQTGLFEEFVTVTNIETVAVRALRLYVGGLRSGVKLYNATGTNSGVPYVEYDPPFNPPSVPPGSSITFVLKFQESVPYPITNSLTVVAILAPTTAPVSGASVNIIANFVDSRIPGDVRFGLEFTSIPGRTYTIKYGPDVNSITNIAVPSIIGSSTSTFWYDDGPPETLSKTPARFYQVILNP